MKKYQLWCEFCDTVEEAQKRIAEYNKTATAWQKKRYPGHWTVWESKPIKKYVVWISW